MAPVALRLVKPEWTDRVPSPAHDALTPSQRAAHLRQHPDSYLGVTRGSEDHAEALPARQLVTEGRKALDGLVAAGAFSEVRSPQLYAYRLEIEGWSQIGIIAGIHVEDYRDGTIRVHEEIHPDRAAHLALHSEVVGAQSSPVAVAHHPDHVITDLLAGVAEGEPLLRFTMPDGLAQTVWAIDTSLTAAIRSELEPVRLYLIDGHHRTAAAALRYDDGGSAWLMAALFSTDQLRSRAFHRLVVPATEDPIAVLSELEGARAGRLGDGTGVIQLYHRGRWLTVTHPRADRPLERLDTWQFEHNIRPALGPGARVGYRNAGGNEAALLAEVDGSGELLALMSAVTMPQLFAVADAGEVMPAKSTYFEPKVRSGVFLRHLDQRSTDP